MERRASNDRRQNLRTWINRPGRLRVGQGRESHAQLVDISIRGAALYSPAPLSPHTDVEVKFHLNMNPKTVWVTVQARVERTYPRGDSHLVRILFVEPPFETIQTILEFLQHKQRPQ